MKIKHFISIILLMLGLIGQTYAGEKAAAAREEAKINEEYNQGLAVLWQKLTKATPDVQKPSAEQIKERTERLRNSKLGELVEKTLPTRSDVAKKIAEEALAQVMDVRDICDSLAGEQQFLNKQQERSRACENRKKAEEELASLQGIKSFYAQKGIESIEYQQACRREAFARQKIALDARLNALHSLLDKQQEEMEAQIEKVRETLVAFHTS